MHICMFFFTFCAFYTSYCLASCVPPQPQHTNVCFWYLPPGIRYMEDKEEKKKRLHKVGLLR